MATAIAQWGSGAGVHVPAEIMKRANWRIGDVIDFEIQKDGVKIVTVSKLTKAERLEARFKNYHCDTRCQEIDWGADVGKEVIE